MKSLYYILNEARPNEIPRETTFATPEGLFGRLRWLMERATARDAFTVSFVRLTDEEYEALPVRRSDLRQIVCECHAEGEE